jgi:diguanylate cyclase (GGDEF)-like protein
VDLDDFKFVNDAQGHAAGDRLLAEIGRRIDSCVRSGDITARLGGDEFTVMLAGSVDRGTATLIAERIIARVQTPIAIDDAVYQVGASIGIAMASDVALEPDALLRAADHAMYRAKRAGKGRWEFSDMPGNRQLCGLQTLPATARSA